MISHSTYAVHRPSSISHSTGERGVALVLTLAILALVTLLLIAFVASMRVENAASKNFNDLIKARELAQAGVDEAVGIIRMAAPPVSTLTNYVTAPGVIYTWSPNIFTPTHWTNVALFTSDPGNAFANPNLTNDGNEVDLNANFAITGSGTVYNTANSLNSHLWVGWSNVTATVNGASQLVGRYAYWVDDESTKVDVNVASTRGNDLEGYTPAAIDLGGAQPQEGLDFTLAEVGSLTNYVQSTRPLDTIQSMMMASPPLPTPGPSVGSTTYSNTQFYVTTHSTSPDITPWGDKRLNLSNVVNVANAGNKKAAVTAIVNWLTTIEGGPLSAWFNGSTFATKYPNLQQIAANIVDYITTDNTPTDSGAATDTTAPTFLGLKETPYINQVVITNSFALTAGAVPPAGTLTISTSISVELLYMYTNSLGWPAPAGSAVALLNLPGVSVQGGASSTITFNNTYTTTTAGNMVVPVGSTSSVYQVLTKTITQPPIPVLDVTAQIFASVVPSAGTLTAIFSSSAGRMDYAQMLVSPIKKTVVPIGSPLNLVSAFQCNDPRLKPVSGPSNWQTFTGSTTLGGPNNPLAMSTGNGSTIPGDGDISCHIVSANPNSGGGRQRGTMTPGEMAFIHTGVPWRTFWLEPQPAVEQSAGLIPDWAILDLFSSTDSTDVVGKININQTITNSVPTLVRNGPLAALLTNPVGVSSFSSTTYSITSAANGVSGYYTNAVPPRAYIASLLGPNFCPYAYTMAGEIANTPSLTAPTTGGSSDKALTETPIRDIANLVTPRSNTFTIWCLAQSVKKVDKTVTNLGSFTAGTDIVTGEAKVQAIVERTVDYTVTPPQVRFRTLYYRYLYQ